MSYFLLAVICLLVGKASLIFFIVLVWKLLNKRFKIKSADQLPINTLWFLFMALIAFFFCGWLGEKAAYIQQDIEVGQKYHAVNLSGTNQFLIEDKYKDVKILRVDIFEVVEGDSLKELLVVEDDSSWRSDKYKKVIYYK